MIKGEINPLHKFSEEACETMDALIFSGDCLYSTDFTYIEEYVARWQRAIDEKKKNGYYAKDGTLLNADGTRSIFDDVDE